MNEAAGLKEFVANRRDTGGSAFTDPHGFIDGPCQLPRVDPLAGNRSEDADNCATFVRPVLDALGGSGVDSRSKVSGYAA